MLTHLCQAVFCLLLLVSIGQAQDQLKQPVILVGPNILVSRDGDFPHVETTLSVNPLDNKNLVGAAVTSSRGDGSSACKTYASTDGGYNWIDSSFPKQLQFGGTDPQVAFSPRGTAFFTSLVFVKDDAGRKHSGLHFYRSDDGGIVWQGPVNLGSNYDHPQLIVDRTRGRVYISVIDNNTENFPLGVFRSDDDGRTFSGPVRVGNGEFLGLNGNPLVLSDGTLIVSYSAFQQNPDKGKLATSAPFFFVSSTDGGLSFSAPTKIHEQYYRTKAADPVDRTAPSNKITIPSYGVAALSDKFRDRLYAAWSDVSGGSRRILFSYSSDRGNVWSEPRPVDQTVPVTAAQYQPALSVSDKGVVAVMWFDTRNLKRGQYHLYFAASIDGGESWLRAVQVSSEVSSVEGSGNLKPALSSILHAPNSSSDERPISIDFTSALLSAANGGDYMGLVSDRDGTFHAFWTDSPSGTFQIVTSQIQVGPATDKRVNNASAVKSTYRLNKEITLVFDPFRFDAETGEAVIPVRLKNISREPLYGPFSVEVKKIATQSRILNASNGASGRGAIFDYSRALRDLRRLVPGAVTEAVSWRIKIADFMQGALRLEVDIIGSRR